MPLAFVLILSHYRLREPCRRSPAMIAFGVRLGFNAEEQLEGEMEVKMVKFKVMTWNLDNFYPKGSAYGPQTDGA